MILTLIYPSVGRKENTPYVRAWQMEPLSMALLASLTPPAAAPLRRSGPPLSHRASTATGGVRRQAVPEHHLDRIRPRLQLQVRFLLDYRLPQRQPKPPPSP